MEAFGGVEVEQWWSTMVDSGGVCQGLGKLEAWCSRGGARLKPDSGSYARVKGKP